ncbi:MAG: Bcr/CflA family drug resistance efflux transporter, partial [Elsteraceae bacterium]
IVIGFAVGAFLSTRLTRLLGVDRMIELGTFSASIGGLGMTCVAWLDPTGASTFGPFGLATPMLLVSGAAGLIMPNAMAGAAAPFPRMAGAASALLGFGQMGFAALVGVAVAAGFDGTGRSMATGVLILAVAGAVIFRLMIKPQNR